MVRKTGKSTTKPNISASRNRAPAEAGPELTVRDEVKYPAVNLMATCLGEPLLYGNGFMGNREVDTLSDVSMETNPGDFSDLPDCMIIDPPETLPEEIFNIREVWNPEPPAAADTLPDIEAPSFSTSTPVVAITRGPLADVTNNISRATLAGAAETTLATASPKNEDSVSPFSLMVGLTQLTWPRENQDDDDPNVCTASTSTDHPIP